MALMLKVKEEMMKKTIQKLISAFTVSLMLICTTGCSEKPSEPDNGAAFSPLLDTQRSCSIRVVGHYSNFEPLEAEFERFNDYYPNVSLSYTFLDNYNSAIGAAIASDEAPNIYTTFSWMIDKPTHKPLFDAAEDLSESSLGFNLNVVKDGLLYKDENGAAPMLPVFSTTFGVLVNEDLFVKEGLSVPQTYDDMISVCESLKQKGYNSPIIGYDEANGSGIFYALSYPYFASTLIGDTDTVNRLNELDATAGEALRPTLAAVNDFMQKGFIDIEECAKLENGYDALIKRFFEGDVPMALVNGDVVSGTRKRESQSEAFTANPFVYNFYTMPLTNDGKYFLCVSALAFSVNKNCGDLDMTNEFMRFLISTEELNNIAKSKRLVATTKDMPVDSVFASLGQIDAVHTIFEQDLGLRDAPISQFRYAVKNVANGVMTVDEAVDAFGTY